MKSRQMMGVENHHNIRQKFGDKRRKTGRKSSYLQDRSLEKKTEACGTKSSYY